MAKSYEDEIALQEERFRFRWEFMRRNPEYRNAYELTLERRKRGDFDVEKVGLSHHHPYFSTWMWKEEKKFAKEFGLPSDFMVNPDKSFEELLESPESFETTTFYPDEFFGDFLEFNYDDPVLTIRLDFSKVNSIPAAKKRLDFFIDHIHENLFIERAMEKDAEGFREIKELRQKDFGKLLEIGDAHDKEGLTFEEIAKRNLSIQYKQEFDGPETARKHAFNLYKEYKSFVDGRYKQITFP